MNPVEEEALRAEIRRLQEENAYLRKQLDDLRSI
jgi:hypothetical protein